MQSIPEQSDSLFIQRLLSYEHVLPHALFKLLNNKGSEQFINNLLMASNSIRNLPSTEEQEALFLQLLHLVCSNCSEKNIYELEEYISQMKEATLRQSPYSIPILSMILTISPFTRDSLQFNLKYQQCIDSIPLEKYIALHPSSVFEVQV